MGVAGESQPFFAVEATGGQTTMLVAPRPPRFAFSRPLTVGFSHSVRRTTYRHYPAVRIIAEVIVVRVDGTEVRRLMKNRSVPMASEPAPSSYSGRTPRASLSNDGALVVVDSNFGEANQQRVLLVETGLK